MYTREIRVEQSGLVSSIGEIKVQIDYGPGLVVNNQQINGIPVDPADFVLVSSGPTGEVLNRQLPTLRIMNFLLGLKR